MLKNNEYFLKKCPVCGNIKLYYLFSIDRYRLTQCDDCGLFMLNPQPSDEDINKIYGANYFIDIHNKAGQDHVEELKRATSINYLELLKQYRGMGGGNLLEIGCGNGDLLAEAIKSGFSVTGVEFSSHACEVARSKLNDSESVICGQIDAISDQNEKYDVCILSDLIEHVRDPKQFLFKVHRLLKPNGIVFIATPTTDSWSARYLKDRWMEFKPEHLYYFSTANLQSLLIQCGFCEIVTMPGIKAMSLDYIADHFKRFPVPIISKIVSFVRKISPSFLRQRVFQIVPSGIIAIARAKEKREKRKLSIVMPAYNESSTLEQALEGVLSKQIDNLDIEVCVSYSQMPKKVEPIGNRKRIAFLKRLGASKIKTVLYYRPIIVGWNTSSRKMPSAGNS